MGNRLKHLFITAVAVIALFGSSIVAHADSGDAWVPDVSNIGVGKTSFFLAEDTQGNYLSTRTGGSEVADGSHDSWWCNDFTSTQCDLNKNSTWFEQYSILPHCESDKQRNCVSALSITLPGKDQVDAQFVRNIEGIKFAPIDSLGLYEATTVSLWNAPNAPSVGGSTDYAVNVRARLHYSTQDQRFITESMSAIVMPYRVLQDARYTFPVGSTIQNAKGTKNLGVAISGIAHECVWNETGKCGVLQDFVDGTIVKLSTRITNEIGGWFKGRLEQPNISVTPLDKFTNLVSVEAKAATVPRMQVAISRESAPADINDIFVHSGVMGDIFSGQPALSDSSGQMAWTYLSKFKSYAKDTAAATTRLWSFASVPAGSGSNCLSDTDKVLGIVTTNSMVYEGKAPAFKSGYINYTVGGLHFMPDGKTPVTGSYDLVMRSTVARCLYGFSTAPISATISIIDSSEAGSIATTSFNESNGWVHFSAKGFGFSVPQIKVKITQSKNAKVTITCVSKKNVKLTKRITAVKPACPTGYKLKK